MTSSLSEPVASTSPVVRTNAGAIRGTADQQALAFLGVPYTAPPVGPLRFAAPCPHPPWNGVREATGLSSAFLQPPDDSPVSAEDALYANVWTPGLGGRRPVFVYIHGGGWQVHSSVKPTYNGARLAVRGQMVVVTFNYRLGPFGFGLHE
ncbi:carboxylesterase family protein, partial [Actinopolyspora mortivallis]|uniref:carboxylesterase family protein n=1 Tax=Actinopolyspora mortivallis TaxID=33906 RepID=UPI0012EDC17F